MIATHVIGAAYLLASWMSPTGAVLAQAEGNTYQSMQQCEAALVEFSRMLAGDAALRKQFIRDVPGAVNVRVRCIQQAKPVEEGM